VFKNGSTPYNRGGQQEAETVNNTVGPYGVKIYLNTN